MLVVAFLALTMLLPAAFSQGADASYGGTLRIGVTSELDNVDRIFTPTSIAVGVPQRLIFDSLAVLNRATMQYQPRLAESWEIADDGLRWRFNLRRDATFHNGDPVTAEDVKFTMDVARLPEYESPYPARYASVADVVVVDDYTLDMHLNAPVLATLEFDIWEHPIYPKSVYESDVQGFGLDPVGSGPFRLVEWRRGLDMTLEANEDYYGGRPYLDEIVLRVMPDDQARVLAMDAGEIDLDLSVSTDDIPRFRANPDLNAFSTEPSNVQFLGFFDEHPYVGGEENRAVRHAIAHAINEGSILSLYEAAGGVPTKNMLPPAILEYNDDVPTYAFDPDTALSLLEEAGWTQDNEGVLRNDEGEQLSIELLTDSSSPDLLDQAQIIQQNLSDIGVDLEIASFEFNTYFEYMRSGNFDLRIARRNGIIAADYLYTYFHSNNIPVQNRNWYDNPRLDELLETGRSAGISDEERLDAYHEAQEILARDLPSYPMVAVPVWLVSQANVVWPEDMTLIHTLDVIHFIPQVYLR
ncbi:MAG: ABC transporter substrate-binding protein, partial [Trueperaceae bacterium]